MSTGPSLGAAMRRTFLTITSTASSKHDRWTSATAPCQNHYVRRCYVANLGKLPRTSVGDRGALLRELMAVFDELPAALRAAINYAPEPLDPKDLATLCRRHGA